MEVSDVASLMAAFAGRFAGLSVFCDGRNIKVVLLIKPC